MRFTFTMRSPRLKRFPHQLTNTIYPVPLSFLPHTLSLYSLISYYVYCVIFISLYFNASSSGESSSVLCTDIFQTSGAVTTHSRCSINICQMKEGVKQVWVGSVLLEFCKFQTNTFNQYFGHYFAHSSSPPTQL